MGLFGEDLAGRIVSRILQDDGIEDEPEELHAVSVRLPSTTKAMVDELAESAGLSRNAMTIDLVRAGIESVLSRLPDPIAEEMREGAVGRL